MYQRFQSAFRGGIAPQSLSYGFLNEIMDHPCSDGGLGSDRIRCTKFCKGCTEGSKVRSEMRIDHQTLSYRFQNEIMDYPYSDGSSRSYRIECTKFNEGCTKLNEGYTKFCEGCTKGFKVRFEMGIDP